VLLLDKTGTITHGNRQATEFFPAPGVTADALAEAAQLASLADETPEGRASSTLAKERLGAARRECARRRELRPVHRPDPHERRRPRRRAIRKGAADAIARFVATLGTAALPPEVKAQVDAVAGKGATPLVVADGARVLGVIRSRTWSSTASRSASPSCAAWASRTVMITGDNPLTAAAIAAEAGVDDFLAEATPEAKLAKIRDYQAKGHLVAMTGDGTNDAPALAQADVAVAMNTGTQAAKEAGNMVDLDSNPTKLIEIVGVGKQLLMTRGALTTFSIANDVAKYFAIIPAAFAAVYPQLDALNVMHLHSPHSAVMSAVIFNALVIVALIPLALRGLTLRPAPAAVTLRRNLLVYGLGGVIAPFPFIKLIDLGLAGLGLA
jgi:K+-transporting ATPase ATPase B chain